MDTFPVLASNTPWRGVERRRGRGPWREVAALQAAQQEDKGQNAFRTGEGERERKGHRPRNSPHLYNGIVNQARK